MKALVEGHSRYDIKGGANKFIVDNASTCEFHFNANDINISLVKSKNSLKCSTVPSFHEIKGRPSACKRVTLTIRGTLEISEEGWYPWR